MTTHPIPHWDLSNVFPGLDSPAFNQAVDAFKSDLSDLEGYLDTHQIGESGDMPVEAAEFAATTAGYVQRMNALLRAQRSLSAYVISFISTDSYNTTAKRVMSELSMLRPRLQQIDVRFTAWIGRSDRVNPDLLEAAIPLDTTLTEHAFVLREIADQSQYLMSEAKEQLAAELNIPGAVAWGQLQGTVTSQLKIPLEVEGNLQQLPLPAVINLRRYSTDEAFRHQAFDAEIAALTSVSEPLTACMNGIKGTVLILNEHRGRTDVLDESLDQSRIDRPTLDAMIAAMTSSFPVFRSYWHKKAERLGKQRLAYWDLYAPVGSTSQTYTFLQASTLIETHFASFSPDLAALAQRAFANNWIDAAPRDGKRGGAFCMSVPSVEESRILCNFDGSLSQLSTIAHELGHAYHGALLKERTMLNRQTPMTMAETASIFCQTIVFEALLSQLTDPQAKLTLLEDSLVDASQIIVDITSRYFFEQKVFAQREKSELSAGDLCGLMAECQLETYGDGLDPEHLHPYMWAWKPHYYSHSRSFYNYPYAFGLLFGLGLYAVYQERGKAFLPDYRSLLSSTGLATAADLAARFNIDLRQPAFWESSLQVIKDRIEEYKKI
ncbi:MAG: M3 family oligoendopeptidase [Anaerolineae bacterium]|nr:M3 family oligoendopeptidase [Anaerolineae bacterium]